ncbi:YlbD family protein [Metabacillus sp. GX 13764]|uniref:YlbD family protein n=1 Tax=Metabacillus kandeliae TaxID=2900151 RepID=UPI001E29F39F|nr:YlbD family protein [Metabacillus kandeliae]MCD7033923.1 YlbD family protein [Metabacillus kandeliae]
MSSKKLHPSVEQFKEFVKRHPSLIQEVRKGKRSWQELYEDWHLLGEDDQMWAAFKDTGTEEEKEDKKQDMMSRILSSVKNMDANEMNQHLYNMSSTVSTIQGILEQFGFAKPSQPAGGSGSQPFSFRKD